MKSVDKLAEILQKERKRKKMHRIVSGMAALVVFITTYVLILPAATLENKTMCGLVEHTHNDSCYETQLVCTQAENESTHEHTDACYISEQVLSCTKPEGEGHTHNDSCYGLICGQSEGEGHTHSDSCYTTTTELTCSQSESSGHTHSDSCYDADGNLTCGQIESAGHTHSDSCYTQKTVLTCGQTESAGHTHSDSCYGLVCGQAETEAHTHDESCYTTNKTLVCTEQQGHKHSDSCYEKVLICDIPEHTHTDSCYENKEDEQKPTITDIPQTIPEIIDNLLCTIPEHTHSDTCYDADGNLICTLNEHTHTDACYNQTTIPEEQIPQEDLPLMAFPDSLPEGYTEYTFSDENGLSVVVYAPDNAFSQDVQLYAKMIAEDSEEYSKAQDNLKNSDTVGEYDGFIAMDIRFVAAELSAEELENAEEIEPDAQKGQVFVKIDAQAVLPENIDHSTVAVQHHAEVKDDGLLGTGLFAGTEIIVETVADDTTKTGEVNLIPSAQTAKMNLETDFGVESFSTFTVTYARPKESTVYTVDTLSKGINIGLFDYSYSINNRHALKFSNGSEFNGFNKWTESANPYQNIVSENLGADGYPTLNSSVTGSNESLSYLFTNDYTGLNHLFQKDSDGYYFYDASRNFAKLNDNKDGFIVYSEPSKVYNADARDPYVYFLPFNSINDTSVSQANYHFGMNIDFNFVMPKNGQISTSTGSKQDMIFEFAGDDDVWVFIDGKLALDLGGIHDAANGSINFNTGEITVNGVKQRETLWSLTNNGHKFANYSVHTFNFFYLERGEGASNCKIKFNLPTIPNGSLIVGKNVENYFDGEVGNLSYTMQVAVDGEALANTDYTDLEGKYLGTTDANGQFDLKHGELVMFKDITANADVTVTEVAVSDSNQPLEGSYDITIKDEDENIVENGSSGTVNMPPAGSVSVIVNNKAKFTAPVTVTKTFDGTTGGVAPQGFEAEFIVYEVGEEHPIGSVKYSDFENSSYTFYLEKGNTYKIVEKVTSNGNTTDLIYKYTMVSLNGNEATKSNEIKFSLAQGGEGANISFTNVYGGTTGDLSITKQVKRTDGGEIDTKAEFEFKIQIDGTSGKNYTATYSNEGGNTHTNGNISFNDENTATVKLYAGETVKISGLPADKTATVTETNTDGYAVSWSGGTATSNDSKTVSVQTALISTNPKLICTNTSGAVLPSTGGMGTKPFILLGIIFTFIAGGLLIVKYRKGDGGVI